MDIKANWHVPGHVHALTTTRLGGVSVGSYEGANLGDHVGDDPACVTENRHRLCQRLGINEIPWLTQVHGTRVLEYRQALKAGANEADGCFSAITGQVCVVMTADCLPVAIYNHSANSVAVVHAGWKGLAAGIVAQGVKALGLGSFSVWLGPAIGPKCFEVGDDVREVFVKTFAGHSAAFIATSPGKWFANMYLLARQQLEKLGITRVYGGEYCTYTDSGQFYSYRRDKTTGRMATLIWLDS